MRGPGARGYFALCRVLGRLLRAGRYSTVRVIGQGADLRVMKRRLLHAPLLVRAGNLLLGILDTGVRVLPQHHWEQRERMLYRELYGASILAGPHGTLVLPCLPGATLSSLLDNTDPEDPARRRAIELAAAALAAFHRAGFTHGDAMAENVLVDLDAGAAHWFDFETIHAPNAPASGRADDVRALLATSLVRAPPGRFADTLHLVLDAYADDRVVRSMAACFGSVFRRPLTFHLAQAPLSFRQFREIGRLLAGRIGGVDGPRQAAATAAPVRCE